jgi:hypothetical protein
MSARTDPRGGYQATDIPTATSLSSATQESQFLVFVDVLIGVGLTSSTPWNEANRKIVDGKGLLSRKSRKNRPNRRKLR